MRQAQLITVVISVSLALASLAFAGGGRHVITAHGVRLVTPSGWQRVQAAPQDRITDPLTLLVVGTRGVRAKLVQCQIAAYRLPPEGAVVVIVGWKSLRYSGGEAMRPGRWPLARLTRVRQPSFECFKGRGAAASLILEKHAYK